MIFHLRLNSPILLPAAVSKTCAMLSNISQYINVVLSNVTHEPVNCSATVSRDCNGMTCYMGYNRASLSFTLVPCTVPPMLHGTLVNDNGTVAFNGTLVNSQELSWDILSSVLRLNVTLQHYSASTIGLKVSLVS